MSYRGIFHLDHGGEPLCKHPHRPLDLVDDPDAVTCKRCRRTLNRPGLIVRIRELRALGYSWRAIGREVGLSGEYSRQLLAQTLTPHLARSPKYPAGPCGNRREPAMIPAMTLSARDVLPRSNPVR